jgi:hypothetical protein
MGMGKSDDAKTKTKTKTKMCDSVESDEMSDKKFRQRLLKMWSLKMPAGGGEAATGRGSSL